LTSSLNGLVSPSWVEITRILPPHIRNASAALSMPGKSSWKAASSKIRKPWRPRRLRGFDESATISNPDANAIRNAWMSRSPALAS